ncbi:MAG: MFS transporter [Burkholderiales bacterium]|nr:MFS transporter [Opitutaceae bacterium]
MSSPTPPPSPHHAQEAPKPSAADRVPFKEKFAYGVGQLGGALQSGSDDRLLLPIFVNALHVSPALMSTLGVVYRIWDAITDMIMGSVSDNTRSRWGRRRPYILIGTVLSAVTLPLFWLLDPAWDTRTIILWMVVGQVILIGCNTIWNIPYQSLLFEMTPSSVERTNVAALRSYFSKAAALGLAWVWWLAQLPVFNGADGKPDIIQGAFWVCAGISVIILVCGFTTTRLCKERFYKAAIKAPKIALWPNIKMTLANRPFQLLALIVLLFVLGTKTNDTLRFFVLLYHVSGGDSELAARLTGWGGTLEVITGIAAIPLVQGCARRYGKRATLTAVMALVGLTGVSTWFTYNPAYPYLTLLSYLISAPAFSAIWILIPSLTGDVVDDEEHKSGTRREGSFAAVFSWTFKLAISVATAGSGLIVVWVGFEAKLGAAQAEGVLFNIRLFLVGTSAVFIGVAVLLCAVYPLTTRRIEQIRAELEARRGAL